MSRIGKLPIPIPSTVEVIQNDGELIVNGKFGTLKQTISPLLELIIDKKLIKVEINNTNKNSQAIRGLYRALINNMIIGVSEQFSIILNLVGVGYRANIDNKKLILNLGYSHPVEINIPNNIEIKIEKNTTLILKSSNKQELGELAAKIRAWRPPEPYKGKGIIFKNEIVKRKAGKSGKK